MNDYERAADEILAKMQNPLSPADRDVARRTLAKLHELTARTMSATTAQMGPIIAESRALYANLATIGDTAAAEVQALFLQKMVEIATATTGRVLRFV